MIELLTVLTDQVLPKLRIHSDLRPSIVEAMREHGEPEAVIRAVVKKWSKKDETQQEISVFIVHQNYRKLTRRVQESKKEHVQHKYEVLTL